MDNKSRNQSIRNNMKLRHDISKNTILSDEELTFLKVSMAKNTPSIDINHVEITQEILFGELNEELREFNAKAIKEYGVNMDFTEMLKDIPNKMDKRSVADIIGKLFANEYLITRNLKWHNIITEYTLTKNETYISKMISNIFDYESLLKNVFLNDCKQYKRVCNCLANGIDEGLNISEDTRHLIAEELQQRLFDLSSDLTILLIDINRYADKPNGYDLSIAYLPMITAKTYFMNMIITKSIIEYHKLLPNDIGIYSMIDKYYYSAIEHMEITNRINDIRKEVNNGIIW